jgi:O-antigen/teichoic acid export membrane protein
LLEPVLMALVGVFSMVFQFARPPLMLVTGPLPFSLYPHVAAIRDDRAKLVALLMLITRVLAMVVVPAVGLVAVASDPIFHLLLSKKWGRAALLGIG